MDFSERRPEEVKVSFDAQCIYGVPRAFNITDVRIYNAIDVFVCVCVCVCVCVLCGPARVPIGII